VSGSRLIPLAPLNVGVASELGRDHAWAIEGVAYRTVASLRVRTVAGEATIGLHHMPVRARRHWPRIGHARWFARIFPLADKPLTITAFDRHGRVVAHRKVF
jgi:hypothetical protein